MPPYAFPGTRAPLVGRDQMSKMEDFDATTGRTFVHGPR
jgi:hypothetical protein